MNNEIDFDKTVSAFDESFKDIDTNQKQYENQNDYTAIVVAPQHKLFEAYKLAWKNYSNFNGRARCSDLWFFVLANIIISFGLSIVSAILMSVLGAFGEVPLLLYWIAVFVPNISLIVRRLHDIGKEWHFIFLSLIPIVGSIILLVWCAGDGDKGTNKFGESPKYIKQAEQFNNQSINYESVNDERTKREKCCEYCGEQLGNDSVFCPNCGKEV